MTDPVREYLAKLGRKGAAVTNSQLTPEQRKKSAKKAAESRWAKVREEMESGTKELKSMGKELRKGTRKLAKLTEKKAGK